VWLVAALLSASTAAAQPRVATAPESAGEVGLKIPMIVWAAGVAADQFTTYRFSSRYGDVLHEVNPLIRGLDSKPALLVAAGTAIDAATGWAAYRWLGRRHPRIARTAFYAAATYRTYLAIYNARMMQHAP